MYLLGLDIGSSSVKASLLDPDIGAVISSAYSPVEEMRITVPVAGWAEQDPQEWWHHAKIAVRGAVSEAGINPHDIGAVGISYQMHGLVAVDRSGRPLRPSIIWCDSRAVGHGEKAFESLGPDYCFSRLLNSPGNFTASKLAWVKENEPGVYNKIARVMLPGDYIAMVMTGEVFTTIPGLSEGIFWDFREERISAELLDHFGFDPGFFPEVIPSFGEQGQLRASASAELGLKQGIPVTYRAGDQPNNAMSLNVMEPGEIAATAGTSGVIYGISDRLIVDARSRVNLFAHVNHSPGRRRLGVLACVNGTGIMNAWAKRITGSTLSYDRMNNLAGNIRPGSENLTIFPFGNGAERILGNIEPGASIGELNFSVHTEAHIFRAVQEGIVYALRYGLDIMKEMGTGSGGIKAGHANMFLSPLFRRLVANVFRTTVTIYDTDGSAGAARGAGVGLGYYSSPGEAFSGMEPIEIIEPETGATEVYGGLYSIWLEKLKRMMEQYNI